MPKSAQNSKPKIVVFSTAYYPMVGGAEIAIREVTKRLSDSYDFELITARLKKNHLPMELVDGVVVHRIGFGYSFDKLLVPFWGAFRAISLRADLFWGVQVTYASLAAYIANIIKFWRKVPTVMTLQEGDSEDHLNKRHFGLIDLSWKLSLPRTDSLTAISNYLKDRATKKGYQGKSVVLPNGINFAHFASGKQSDEFRKKYGASSSDTVLFSVSRLVEKNALDVVIRSLNYLPGNVKLWLAGTGPLESRLKKIVAENDLAERVVFLGNIDQSVLPDYLASADIFTRPSRSEGLGISFIEAQAAGLPVIATEVGGIPDIIEDGETGLFSKVDDPEDLAKQVKRVTDSRELAESLGKNARAFAESFDWDKLAHCYKKEVFENLLASSEGKRVLIASPAAPDGKPTYYASSLAKAMSDLGHRPEVLLFSNTLPTGVRHLWYALRLVKRALSSDFIIALDNYSVAWSAIWAGVLTRKPRIVRIGGDFLWEAYINRTGEKLALSQFYTSPVALTNKEQAIKFFTQIIYNYATALVFSTDWQYQITRHGYQISEDKVTIVANNFPSRRFEEAQKPNGKNFVWIGRDIPLKNVEVLEKATKLAKESDPEVSLSINRDLKQGEVWDKLAECYAFVYPSVSEVSPNLVLQAISYGKPFIMTRESGLARELSEIGLMIDSNDPSAISEAMLELSKPEVYESYAKKVKGFKKTRSYKEIAADFIEVYESLNNR